jgi:excisionase family DNA binding protein
MNKELDAVIGSELPRVALSRDEAAQMAGVSTRFIDMEIKRGSLKARKFSRRKILIQVADFQRWLNGSSG